MANFPGKKMMCHFPRTDRALYDAWPRQGEGIRRLGVDVARMGTDRTTLVLRQGSVVDHLKVYGRQDTMQTVGCIVAMLTPWKVDEVTVDVIGLGAGVYDRLVELKRQGAIACEARSVNVAEKAPPGSSLRMPNPAPSVIISG